MHRVRVRAWPKIKAARVRVSCELNFDFEEVIVVVRVRGPTLG